MVTIVYAVDFQTLIRMAVVGQEGVPEHVIATVVSLLHELGHQRVSLKSDSEPSVTALTHEISQLQVDHGCTTIIQENPLGNAQVIGIVEHGSYQLGCHCRALRSSIEDRFGANFLLGLLVIAWQARHSAWIMVATGSDVMEPRLTIATRVDVTMENCAISSTKSTYGRLWLDKSSRDDSYLIFDDEVIQVRTVKHIPEERR